MNLSTYEIKTFLEIAASRNLSRAAEKLSISQPALSMALKRIENYFGVNLFVRTKHGLELTKAASTLVQEAKLILRDLENLREKVLKQTYDFEGLYTIGFHPQVAAHSFPQFAQFLLEKSSELNVKLVYEPSRRILSDVVDYKIDFGLVVNPLPHPELTIIKLYKDSIYFWINDKINSLNDLKSPLTVVYYDQNLAQMESLLVEAKLQLKIPLQRIIHSPDLDNIREFVSRGLGVGILPATIALKNDDDKLKRLNHLPHFDEQICLIYRADMQRTQAAKFIKDKIVAGCQKK